MTNLGLVVMQDFRLNGHANPNPQGLSRKKTSNVLTTTHLANVDVLAKYLLLRIDTCTTNGKRGRRRKGGGALNLRIASFTNNLERQSYVRRIVLKDQTQTLCQSDAPARAHGRLIMGFASPSLPLSHGENYKKKVGVETKIGMRAGKSESDLTLR
ncbi:hypothetical protein EVAR_20547_1 [Eumeta japonica]|uniref:Uncharacterized protein n=1 Tax=Eumeta variegata TaxID=151549 RepID=A0A4C1UT31_EUMVA|nr:hypothetical protein EVAR_20547_1 [Eumeta japonica]